MGGAIVLLIRGNRLNNGNIRILAVSCPAWWVAFQAFTQHCPIIVINRALMNIIKSCFLGVLTSLLRVCVRAEISWE